jgi:hypothetical protein
LDKIRACITDSVVRVLLLSKKKEGDKVAGYDNIKGMGFETKTAEERRELAVRAGKASGEARRKKKKMREQMEMLLSLPIQGKRIKNKMNQLGIEEGEQDNQMALVMVMFAEALKGNVQALNAIRDLIGEKPSEDNW